MLISEHMCLHNWWNCFVEPLIRVNWILNVGWLVVVVVVAAVVVVTGGLWLPMFIFVLSTCCCCCWPTNTTVALVTLLLLLFTSVMISTLKRTLRAKNLSGERYSQRNRLGLFMLWMRSWVCRVCLLDIKIFRCYFSFFPKNISNTKNKKKMRISNIPIRMREWDRLWRYSAVDRWLCTWTPSLSLAH